MIAIEHQRERAKGFKLPARWRALALPAVLAPVAETAVLRLFGPGGSAALGPQITAPPPFDLFHDLRWISVYHDSWVTLALEFLGILVLRSAYMAWAVRTMWPLENKPSLGAATRRILIFYALVSLLLMPWVLLLFGFAITGLSYLFFAALPPVLAIGVILHAGAIAQGAGDPSRWRPTWASMGWVGAAFLWLTTAGAIASTAPLAIALLCAAVAGALNARAVIGIVDGVAAGHLTRKRSAISVSIAVFGVFAVAVAGTLAGFSAAASAARTHDVAAPIPRSARGRPVIVAAGFGSHWNPTSPLSLPKGYVGWRYSYEGLDRSGRLRPYGPRDTIQSLGVSARRLGAEVDALFRAYGKPVSIVAESEGALVARTYLLRDYSPASHEVDRLITLDMPRVQGSVYFPPDGGQGWGVASGLGLRGLASVIGRMSRLPFSTQAPLMKEVLRCRSSINSIGSAALPPGIQEARVVALADAVAGEPGSPKSISRYVVTAAHGGLIHKASVVSIIAGILEGTGHQASGRALALVRILGDISAPWSTPSLAAGWGPAKIC